MQIFVTTLTVGGARGVVLLVSGCADARVCAFLIRRVFRGFAKRAGAPPPPPPPPPPPHAQLLESRLYFGCLRWVRAGRGAVGLAGRAAVSPRGAFVSRAPRGRARAPPLWAPPGPHRSRFTLELYH